MAVTVPLRLADVGFTRVQLEGFRNGSVPDLAGPGLRLVFVGINPSLWTAGTGTHFSHPGNRFYPALRQAGIIERDLDRAGGMTDDDRAYFLERGLGITNLVNRATIRADELSAAELRAGSERLRSFVVRHRPLVLAVAGITAYRQAFGRPRARAGEQPDRLEGARVWVVPNPSGLNAHETTATLAAAYAEPARAAGILPALAAGTGPDEEPGP